MGTRGTPWVGSPGGTLRGIPQEILPEVYPGEAPGGSPRRSLRASPRGPPRVPVGPGGGGQWGAVPAMACVWSVVGLWSGCRLFVVDWLSGSRTITFPKPTWPGGANLAPLARLLVWPVWVPRSRNYMRCRATHVIPGPKNRPKLQPGTPPGTAPQKPTNPQNYITFFCD